jgi:cytochrome c
MHTGAIAVAFAGVLFGLGQWALAQSRPPDTDEGQLAFSNACRMCHTMREGDNRLGPSLYKVVGRKAGSVSGYGYSRAMQDSGIVWNRATLDRFIADPEQVVRGNAMMPYGGIASAEQRARIIAYLEASGGWK